MKKFESLNKISEVLYSRRVSEMLIAPTELFSGTKIIGVATTHLLSEDNKQIKFHRLKEFELDLFSRYFYKKYYRPDDRYIGFPPSL